MQADKLCSISSFNHNDVPRGAAVAMTFYPVTFSGFNIFQDNRGPSLAVSYINDTLVEW